ncbi:MAG TPA: biotin--[acetyl-CoA-carboxylase] ligase [Syntrophorhabdaceae bacterium]|nr:biotin--[acetyl-CoA-carboxylase] ligase [Syntrophorhabdaceae bacterium]HQM82818.1 biotin--[acetyl-CoA-carboxylase] ligase [Syntrophorhabdaceae bacterium]
MDKIGEVLILLRESGDYVSGDFIASRLHVSRTAVWKYINHLERLGYLFQKSKGKGYRITGTPDKLYSWEIHRHLITDVTGRRVVHKETVDSTNAFAFKLALSGEPEGTCVVAESQGAGKGRLGRKWFSPAGKNLYISLLLRPHIHPSLVYPITFLSSLAVYDTIKELSGITPSLKWPNDVLINGKKVCGTLIELSTEADMVKFVVVGIGLNINMRSEEVDKEIKNKATSLSIETKKIYERALVCGILLNHLEKHYRYFSQHGAGGTCGVWEERAAIKGKALEINQMGESFRGIVEGIDRDGAMLLNIDGETKKIIAGDVNF